jgi:hypothetical protein
MCAKTATALMKDVPFAPFSNKPPVAEKPAEKNEPPASLAEDEEKPNAKEEVANSKRFQFITTNSGLFGVWDGTSATVLSLFHDKTDAISELIRLKTGKPYGIDSN